MSGYNQPCVWPALSHRPAGRCWLGGCPAAAQQSWKAMCAAHPVCFEIGPDQAVHIPADAADGTRKSYITNSIVYIVNYSDLLELLFYKNIFSLVCQQFQTPSCPSGVWSHTVERQSPDAPSLGTAGTQSDDSGSLSLFFSGKALS